MKNDHRYVAAAERDARRALQDATAAVFEQKLPFQVFAHLTFPHPVTEVERDDAFQQFMTELQRLFGISLGYLRGDEARPYRHLHLVLIAHRHLPIRWVEYAWLSIVGVANKKCAQAFHYRPGGGGASYSMKSDGEFCTDWKPSKNLDLFARPSIGVPGGRTTSRQRRYATRIRKQRMNRQTVQVTAEVIRQPDVPSQKAVVPGRIRLVKSVRGFVPPAGASPNELMNDGAVVDSVLAASAL